MDSLMVLSFGHDSEMRAKGLGSWKSCRHDLFFFEVVKCSWNDDCPCRLASLV
jgi:hypothetical protein